MIKNRKISENFFKVLLPLLAQKVIMPLDLFGFKVKMQYVR